MKKLTYNKKQKIAKARGVKGRTERMEEIKKITEKGEQASEIRKLRAELSPEARREFNKRYNSDKNFAKQARERSDFRDDIRSGVYAAGSRISRSDRLTKIDTDAYTSTSVTRRLYARGYKKVESGLIKGVLGEGLGEAIIQGRRAKSSAEAKEIRRDYVKRAAANFLERSFGIAGEAWAQRIRQNISQIRSDDPAKGFIHIKQNFANVSQALLNIDETFAKHNKRIQQAFDRIEQVRKTASSGVTSVDNSLIETSLSKFDDRIGQLELQMADLKADLASKESQSTVKDTSDDVMMEIQKLQKEIKKLKKDGGGKDDSSFFGKGLLKALGFAAAGLTAGAGITGILQSAEKRDASRFNDPERPYSFWEKLTLQPLFDRDEWKRQEAAANKDAIEPGVTDTTPPPVVPTKKEETEEAEPWWKRNAPNRWFSSKKKKEETVKKKEETVKQPSKGLFGLGGFPNTNSAGAHLTGNDTAAQIYRSKVEQETKQFMQFGKLPEGFEFIGGHMGRLGQANAVMAAGAMPLEGGPGGPAGGSFGGMYPGGLGTAESPYSSGGRQGGFGSPTAPDAPYSGGLKDIREQRFRAQLTDDEVRNIAALGIVETGGMSARSKQAWLETYVNRATVRNKSLSDLRSGNDRAYWGGGLGDPRRVTDKQLAEWRGHLENVMSGSNITDLATDNASNDYKRGNLVARNRIMAGRKGVWTEGTTGDPIKDMDKGEFAYVDKPYEAGVAKLREHLKKVDSEKGKVDPPKSSATTPSAAPEPAPAAPAPAAPTAAQAKENIAPNIIDPRQNPIGSLKNQIRLDSDGYRHEREFMVPGLGTPFNYAETKQGQQELAGSGLVQITTHSGRKFTVNSKIADDAKKFLNEAESLGYKIEPGSYGHSHRAKVGGGGMSMHSYGIAIDLNSGKNPYKSTPGMTDMPENMKFLAMKYGFAQLGFDRMHFERVSPQHREAYAKALIQKKMIAQNDPILQDWKAKGWIKEEEIAQLPLTGGMGALAPVNAPKLYGTPYVPQPTIPGLKDAVVPSLRMPTEAPDVTGDSKIAEADQSDAIGTNYGTPVPTDDMRPQDSVTPPPTPPPPPSEMNTYEEKTMQDIKEMTPDLKYDQRAGDPKQSSQPQTTETGGGGYGGRHNPESRPGSPGSGGYGSHGRCFV